MIETGVSIRLDYEEMKVSNGRLSDEEWKIDVVVIVIDR